MIFHLFRCFFLTMSRSLNLNFVVICRTFLGIDLLEDTNVQIPFERSQICVSPKSSNVIPNVDQLVVSV